MKALPRDMRERAANYVNTAASIPGVTSSSASILGKNYVKQVDVIMTDWVTGPELLISTKRMDSSYGKNAPNRVEESYGDAKNLRLRHPLAALGFVFGLRSDILEKEPRVAAWLCDLLGKLGREDDAYHATCLVLMEYADEVAIANAGEEPAARGVPEPGLEIDSEEDAPADEPTSNVDRDLALLPSVRIVSERTPLGLDPGRFLKAMILRVLDATPVNMHEEARRRLNFLE
ncbi:hypothetical protein [Massilia terrae]|uniref:Uncharacterized protein n=1 Tax=Massilia terrae TaxID=1811224 RepID=A0ABT2CWS2_9BURK|nr:hypothetical protein [Massilia terrae]MCS0658437.1 hypothetical protein [Massilia terrae]